MQRAQPRTDDEGGQGAEETAAAIFSILDADRSGKITTSELMATLKGMNVGLSDDEIMAAMQLFDHNKSGDITKHEFIQAVELMKTFE